MGMKRAVRMQNERAAPLPEHGARVRFTGAGIRERARRPIVPVGGCGFAAYRAGA